MKEISSDMVMQSLFADVKDPLLADAKDPATDAKDPATEEAKDPVIDVAIEGNPTNDDPTEVALCKLPEARIEEAAVGVAM